MKAIFKDHDDATLFVAELRTSVYDPTQQILYFTSTDDDDIAVPGIDRTKHIDVMQQMYRDNKVDLSAYNAYLNEDPPEPDRNDNQRVSLFAKSSGKKDPWDN